VESAPLKDRVVHSRWIVGGLVRTPLAVALLGSWLVALLASGIAKGKVGGQGLLILFCGLIGLYRRCRLHLLEGMLGLDS
jgi:hypothetical protein